MKTISVAVSKVDYEIFREAAQGEGRSIAQLIREAMALYREQRLEARTRLVDIPVLLGHRSIADTVLPSREALYDEIFTESSSESSKQRHETDHEPEAKFGDDSQ